MWKQIDESISDVKNLISDITSDGSLQKESVIFDCTVDQQGNYVFELKTIYTSIRYHIW